jgi:hypothetical protein
MANSGLNIGLNTGSSASTSGGTAWSSRPASWGGAHAYDDEFTADTTANYTFSPSLSGSAIDPYATITTNPRVGKQTINPSYLSCQIADATSCWMAKPVTLDTNCAVWLRYVWHSMPSGQSIDSDTYHAIWFGLSETTTIESSTEHYVAVQMGPNEASATDYAVSSRRRVGGGAAVIGGMTMTNPVNAMGAGNFTQILIQKQTDNYKFYVATDSLNWYYLGSYDFSGNTLDHITMLFQDDDGLPGSTVGHLDFIRYYSGIAPLPA